MRFRFALAALTTLSLLTHSVEAADYKYPYRDPYLATATTAILSDDGRHGAGYFDHCPCARASRQK